MYDRFKLTVLEDAPHMHQASIAYFWAQRAFPDKTDAEQDRLVRQALLELLDEGLIFFYWGDWNDGVLLDPAKAPRATRAEVEADLSIPGSAPPRRQTVWFTTTAAGLAMLDTLPRKTFLEA